MIAADNTLHAAATSHGDAVLRVIDALRAARAWQWDPALGESTRAVSISDPTGEVATSTSRLMLRAAVEDALARLAASTADLNAAADRLDEAREAHTNPYRKAAA